MAKEIKVIQCPKCGSTQKTEVKPDYFRCDSCQTEYFLDNDDINVNINQKHYMPPANDTMTKVRKPLVIIFASIFGLIVLSNVLTAIFRSKPSAPKYTVSERGSASSKDDEEEDIRWSSDKPICLINDKNNPVIMRVGTKEWGGLSSQDKRNGLYVEFYDPVKKESIKSEKIGEKTGGITDRPDIKIRQFSNGKTYFTVGKNKIYLADEVTLTLKDMSVDLFKSQVALSSGVASMEFVYENYGDGLIIMTNDGNNYYYYPLVNKLYSKDQFNKARGGYNTLLPGAKDRYMYMVTDKSDDYPNEKEQLMKILYSDNIGGPKDMISHMEWFQDYGAGLHYDNDPYKKTLINEWNRENSRIKSYTDICPGRLFFNATVQYYDDAGDLIVKFYPDVNPSTTPSLQSLNNTTGAIKWTYPLKTKETFDQVCKFSEGYLFLNSSRALMLDKNGKELSTFSYKD